MIHGEKNLRRVSDSVIARYAAGRRIYEERLAQHGPVRVIVKDGKRV